MVGVPVWLGLTRFRPILTGHPVMVATAFASLVVGLFAVVLGAVAVIDRLRPPPVSPRSERRGGKGRRRAARIASVPALVVCIAAVLLLSYSRPLGADTTAVQAMQTRPTVAVRERLTSFDLVPTRQDSRGRAIAVRTGLVFYPGAKVDARAYAALLRPLASAGYLVVVLKEPFGLALLDTRQGQSIPSLHPEITHWAVGGHSLGGVAAASLADQDRDFSGLLLYASQPASQMDRVNLAVLSISGSNDGLETPAKIQDSKADLPPGSKFQVIKGAVHAYFGDYGVQPGDGTPGVSRSSAQAQIVAATRQFLVGLAAKPSSTGRTPSPSSSASPTR